MLPGRSVGVFLPLNVTTKTFKIYFVTQIVSIGRHYSKLLTRAC